LNPEYLTKYSRFDQLHDFIGVHWGFVEENKNDHQHTKCSVSAPFWLFDYRPRAVEYSSFVYGLLTSFALVGIPALLIIGEPILGVFSVIAAITGKWAHAQIPVLDIQES
jgi:hypothetical protein